MKKLIFFFCFLVAIIQPHITYSKGLIHTHDFKISQKQSIPIQNLIQEDLFFNNDYIATEAEDDINDSERKSFLLQKTPSKTISFIVEYYSSTLFKKACSNKHLFYLHSPLFIFISVFRL
jgi:hypothetical protein